MNKLILLMTLLSLSFSLSAQVRLDVEGDVKILGKLNLIKSEIDSSLFIGANAGMNDDGTDNRNTFVGFNAGKANTTGTSNSFFGLNAGKANIIGSSNSFFGRAAGHSNTTGTSNSFFGLNAGKANTYGFSNSFFGRDAGLSNTTGEENSFFGRDAGLSNTTGEENSFFGRNAGLSNTTGKLNSFFGLNSGVDNTTGIENTFIGRSAGYSTNSTRGTMLGSLTRPVEGDSLDRAIAIGYRAEVGCHNCAVIGGTGVNAVKVGIGTTTPTSDLHIKQSGGIFPGLGTGGITFEDFTANVANWQIGASTGNFAFVFDGAIKASITGNGNYVDFVPFTSSEDGTDLRRKHIKPMSSVLQKVQRLKPATKQLTTGRNSQKAWGFVAEEVAQLFPEITPTINGQQGMIYDYFGILSIKAIQELTTIVNTQAKESSGIKAQHEIQNKTIVDLEEKLETQQQQMDEQQSQIAELKSLVEKLLNERAETPKNTSLILPFLLLDILKKNKKVIALIVTKQLTKISYDCKNTS